MICAFVHSARFWARKENLVWIQNEKNLWNYLHFVSLRIQLNNSFQKHTKRNFTLKRQMLTKTELLKFLNALQKIENKSIW